VATASRCVACSVTLGIYDRIFHSIHSLSRSDRVGDRLIAAICDSCLFFIDGNAIESASRLGKFENCPDPGDLKILVLPSLVAVGTTLLGLSGDPRLSLVLMAGMPSAFASLILAEEYNLDRNLASSSIALSTIGLLFVIHLWLSLFGGNTL